MLSIKLTEYRKALEADPVALAVWDDARRRGLEAFHADPVRKAAWLKVLSKAMIALWRDPDWVLSRSRAYYAVRPLPEAKAASIHLFLAGWDGRTVSLIF